MGIVASGVQSCYQSMMTLPEKCCKSCPCAVHYARCCQKPDIHPYFNLEYVPMAPEGTVFVFPSCSMKRILDPGMATLKVMSYNFLVYHHATLDSFPWSKPDSLWFKKRSTKILKEIKKSYPDIICCQVPLLHCCYTHQKPHRKLMNMRTRMNLD